MRANKVMAVAAVLTLLAAIAAAAVVRAQGPATRWRMGHAFGVRRLHQIGRQLDLTAQQKQQIKDIVKGRKDDIRALVDQGFAARKALRQAIAGGDNRAIETAANQLSVVELKGAQLRAQLRAKIFSEVLHPDQRNKAEALLAGFEERADRRRQRIKQFLDTF